MMKPEVTIEQGTLLGFLAKDYDGNDFYKFQGIPYAKPPLGNLRFKAPEPPEKWSGIFDATKEGDVCYARDPLKNNAIFGSENCLVLNIATKKLSKNNEDLRPVLFWIHGGGCIFGSGSEELYGPEFLITQDVVVVTINFRLGLLGYISFEDTSLDIPGNAGAKDQVRALKWVQNNISKFGGDPNNVTIFGESAGGAAVHFLMLSPLAKGLFHKGIAQSGCAFCPLAYGTRGTKAVAKAMNLEGETDRTMYNTLMQKSVEEIYEIQQGMTDQFVANDVRPFGPIIEKSLKNAFLSDDPLNIMLSSDYNHVPLIIGYNSKEGMSFELHKEINPLGETVCNYSVPWIYGYQKGSPESQNIIKKLQEFYFGNEIYSEKLKDKKIDILTDCHFLHPAYLTVIGFLQNLNKPIYFYRMSIETELNFFKKFLQIEDPGVSHMDDIGYLFKNVYTPETAPDSIEEISMRKFVKMWTNFAKFGNPTPDQNDYLLKSVWKPVTGPNLEYLDIGKELVPMSYPDSERLSFWRKIFAESPIGKKFQELV